jgi:hypothetical protein
LAFKHSVERAQTLLEFDASNLPADESKWLNKVDASIFHASFWENLKELNADELAIRDSALAALRSLHGSVKSKPDKYYAVLALDGDEIGKWLSGEKTPRVREVITDKSVEWFEAKMPRESSEWLDGHRPLSPGYHLQFSEALANFGLHCARRIVEHHGIGPAACDPRGQFLQLQKSDRRLGFRQAPVGAEAVGDPLEACAGACL